MRKWTSYVPKYLLNSSVSVCTNVLGVRKRDLGLPSAAAITTASLDTPSNTVYVYVCYCVIVGGVGVWTERKETQTSSYLHIR